MTMVPMVIGKYSYFQEGCKGDFQAVDLHHVFVQKRSTKGFLFYLTILPLLAYISSLILFKEKPGDFFVWNLFLGIFILRAWNGKLIKKESVVILPGFGVQLETHYKSGKVKRGFVPIGNILRPVLNECVTPVTCYWSLALILRGEAELMLVFRELQPPVKMLVPIWKALCVATDSENHKYNLWRTNVQHVVSFSNSKTSPETYLFEPAIMILLLITFYILYRSSFDARNPKSEGVEGKWYETMLVCLACSIVFLLIFSAVAIFVAWAYCKDPITKPYHQRYTCNINTCMLFSNQL